MHQLHRRFTFGRQQREIVVRAGLVDPASQPGRLDCRHPLIPLLTYWRRALDDRHTVVGTFNRVEVDRHDQIAVRRHHRDNRQRVEQTAVNQHTMALLHRREQAGNRRRRAHGLMQTAALKPDFLLIGQVGRHRGKRDTQVLDLHFAENLANTAKYPFSANGAEIAEADIQQPNHIQIIQPGDPVPVVGQPAGSMDPPHNRAH